MGRVWHVFSHTHWDREWYLPFETYRARAVELMDEVLRCLKSPGFRSFTLDGQTILLEDYLEVCPEREETLRKLVKKERLFIGPWYVLPDEFLAGGEALVRNLALGMRIAGRLGGALRIGYLPDMFGHVAQMPQILAGFGIDRALLWRGVDDDEKDLFFWKAATGKSILVHRFHGNKGYGFAKDLPEEETAFCARVDALLKAYPRRSTTSVRLLPNGSDHRMPQPFLPQAIKAFNAAHSDGADKLIHSHLVAYFEDLEWALEPETLDTVSGELRSGKHAPVLPGTLSSRYRMKRLNEACNDLLVRCIEPIAGQMVLCKEPPPSSGLIAHAWRLLLSNHAHDTICGCSVDAVHDEAALRFEKVGQIGRHLWRRLADDFVVPGREEEGLLGTAFLFNPAGVAQGGSVRVVADLSGRVSSPTFFDGEGRPLAAIVLERADVPSLPEPNLAAGRSFAASLELPDEIPYGRESEAKRWTCLVRAPVVPAAGSASIVLRAGKKGSLLQASWGEGRSLNNGILAVRARPKQGCFDVKDLRTGDEYPGIARFLDRGDRGDAYNFCPVGTGRALRSLTKAARVRRLDAGTLGSSLRLRFEFEVPAGLEASRKKRSRRRVRIPIEITAFLAPDTARLDFAVRLENRASNHLLQAEFPLPGGGGRTRAGSVFAVTTRTIEQKGGDDWVEQPGAFHPMETWVSCGRRGAGCAVFARGLRDYEAVHEGSGKVVLRMNLLRSTGTISRGDLETRRGHAGPPYVTPDGQQLGSHEYELAWMPLGTGGGDPLDEAERFRYPLLSRFVAGAGKAPERLAGIELPTGISLSCLKPAVDGRGVIMRLYNASGRDAVGVVGFPKGTKSVEVVDLSEKGTGDTLKVRDGKAAIGLRAEHLLTLRLLAG